MIAGVSTVRNEVDIIGDTLRHLFLEGVDRIYIADGRSDDGTRERYKAVDHEFPDRLVVFDDDKPYHYQPFWVDKLAGIAASDGAEWIVPFDADEFWYATDRRSLSEALHEVPAVSKLWVTMYQHHGWDYREILPKPLPKVAYRWEPEARISNGNHDVTVSGATLGGVLELREIQYRSFEHFCRKIIERNTTINPTLGPDQGAHHKRLAGLPESELRSVWDAMQEVPTVYDPIPSRA